MATRGERLGFGPPHSFSQVLDRLPFQDEVEINAYGDEGLKLARQHLASLKITLIESLAAIASCNTVSLSDRMVPLSHDDLQLASQIGFRRENELAAFPWATLESDNVWAELFLSGDTEYKSWQIWEMAPDISSFFNSVDGDDLETLSSVAPHCICIQTNSDFNSAQTNASAAYDADYWSDTNFPFNVGIVTEEELKALLLDLGKRQTTSGVE